MRGRNSLRGRSAFKALCRAYWPPIYGYIRRRGHAAHEAEDLTQAFFAELLDPGALARVDREKGKFREFLLACCNHFLAHCRERDHALKRGGRHRPLSIDVGEAEGHYLRELSHDATPEALFDRRWASTLLANVFDDLRAESETAGKSALFDALKANLFGEPDAARLAAIAERLGTTGNAVGTAAHRLRRRYREVLRQRIAATVADPSEIDDEIRDLFAAVAAR